MTILSSRRLMLATILLSLASAATAKDKAPADPNRKVCHSDIPTGSRMAKRICHTAAEWAQIDAANASAAQTSLDHASRNGSAQ